MEKYVTWNNVPEGLVTKNSMRKEFGLKPSKGAKPCAIVKVYTHWGWKEYDLYKLCEGVEIKKRKIDISMYSIENDGDIAEALYVINKSAKISRDTKQSNYHSGKYDIVKRSKNRQEKLYHLKDTVIKELLIESRLNLLGYHKQFNSYLLLYEISGHTFHIPTFDSVQNIKYLGELNQKISSESTKTTRINYFESVALLEKYIISRSQIGERVYT